jgi:hypothetical protein
MVRSHVPLCRSVRGTKEGLAVLAIAAIKTSIPVIRRLFNEHSGSGIYEGSGGASKNINGIDIWLVGTPPRKFRIIGYITDSRPGGLIPMARRDADLAAEAKKNRGDGILLKADRTDFIGVYSTGNANCHNQWQCHYRCWLGCIRADKASSSSC